MKMTGEFTSNMNSTERSLQKSGRKNIFVVGNSMLNNICKYQLSKQHLVKIKSFPRGNH